MLKKENRLKLNSAFVATYLQKHVFCGKFFKVYLGKKTDSSDNSVKVGFVVSKKVHKRAVIRNRIKRYARETIRNLLKDPDMNKKLSEYLSIVIVGKMNSFEADYSDIENDLKEIFNKKII